MLCPSILLFLVFLLILIKFKYDAETIAKKELLYNLNAYYAICINKTVFAKEFSFLFICMKKRLRSRDLNLVQAAAAAALFVFC